MRYPPDDTMTPKLPSPTPSSQPSESNDATNSKESGVDVSELQATPERKMSKKEFQSTMALPPWVLASPPVTSTSQTAEAHQYIQNVLVVAAAPNATTKSIAIESNGGMKPTVANASASAAISNAVSTTTITANRTNTSATTTTTAAKTTKATTVATSTKAVAEPNRGMKPTVANVIADDTISSTFTTTT